MGSFAVYANVRVNGKKKKLLYPSHLPIRIFNCFDSYNETLIFKGETNKSTPNLLFFLPFDAQSKVNMEQIKRRWPATAIFQFTVSLLRPMAWLWREMQDFENRLVYIFCLKHVYLRLDTWQKKHVLIGCKKDIICSMKSVRRFVTFMTGDFFSWSEAPTVSS